MSNNHTVQDFKSAGYARSLLVRFYYKVLDAEKHDDGSISLLVQGNNRFWFPSTSFVPVGKEEYEKAKLMEALQ